LFGRGSLEEQQDENKRSCSTDRFADRFAARSLIQRVLEFGLSPQVRNQDSLYVYADLLLVENPPAARKQAWDFIREHWPQIQAKLTDANVGFVVEATGSFCDPASRDQVRMFFTEHKVPSAERAARKGLERIDYCIDLKTQQEPKLASWFDRRGKTYSPPSR
jgi:ERAP1-like protein